MIRLTFIPKTYGMNLKILKIDVNCVLVELGGIFKNVVLQIVL